MRYVPIPLPDAAWDRRLRDLCFRFHKWDMHVRGRATVERGALVLTRAEHEHLVRASEALYALADRAAVRVAADPDARRALGVPDAVARLAADATRRPRVTRIDWFPTPDGWRASEFNDDVPGGYNDAVGVPALLEDAVEKGLAIPGDLPDALARLVAPEPAAAVALVYATAYAEDLQVVRLVADLLEARGVTTVAGSPADFSFDGEVARLGDERVTRAFRFFPAEWFPLLDNLPQWEAAARAGFPVTNPFSAAWTQSKALFAWLHAHAEGADRNLVRDTLPPTRSLDAAADAERDRERLVLKPAFGRMGEGVVLGALVTADAWRKALAHASVHRRRAHVLQDRFLVTPLEVAPGVTRTPCVGAYVVDGRFAGYYSRLSNRPVVAYDATNILTLVEGL